MPRRQDPNLESLERAVAYLGALSDQMVFLGGCATGLLLTDAAAPPIRVTRDVDVITDVASLAAYHHLSAALRLQGFKEDQSAEAPLCRWVAAGVVLDVMPTDPAILGFGNDWYQPALDAAVTVELPSGRGIRRVTAPYFLATKLAAFDDRGKGDYAASHDMEDVVAVLDGRPETVGEVMRAQARLRSSLAARFRALLDDEAFTTALSGHLPGDSANQARAPWVIERIEAIADLDRDDPAAR